MSMLFSEHSYVLELWFEDDYEVSIYELDFSPLLIDDDPGSVFLFLKTKNILRTLKQTMH